MVRTPIVPYRWTGYGLDIRTYLNGRGPLFFAADICIALDIDVPFETDRFSGRVEYSWPAGVVHHVDVRDADNFAVPMYGVDEVRRLAYDNTEYFTVHFLEWFEQLVSDLSGDSLLHAISNTIGEEPGLSEPLNYSIGKAARILSGDPVLSYSQTSLFDTLHGRLRWIDRVSNIWVPTADAMQAGYLIRQQIPLPRAVLYPQIRITGSGLEELHRRLGGVADLNLNPTAPLTLVEIE